MPPFPERESSILAKLKKKKQEKTGIIEKEEKTEPVEKPTANGQVPVTINEVHVLFEYCKSPWLLQKVILKKKRKKEIWHNII